MLERIIFLVRTLGRHDCAIHTKLDVNFTDRISRPVEVIRWRHVTRWIKEVLVDKSTVRTKIIEELENQLEFITHSALEAEEESHQENDVPASQIDHRALEASLLAKIQSGRVKQAKNVIQMFKDLPLRPFSKDDEILPTALVELEHDGESHFYFLGPKGAGTVVECGGHNIEVITPFSPLGEELLEKQVDDQILVESPKGIQEFVIKSVC